MLSLVQEVVCSCSMTIHDRGFESHMVRQACGGTDLKVKERHDPYDCEGSEDGISHIEYF